MRTPSSPPLAVSLGRPPPAQQTQRDRLLAAIDWVLSEELRRAPPHELRRARFLAGGSLLMQALMLSLAVYSLAAHSPIEPTISMVIAVFSWLLVLGFLRRGRAVLAGAWACVYSQLSMLFVVLHHDGVPLLHSPWQGVLVMLGMYLVNGWFGFASLLSMCAELVVIPILDRHGWLLGSPFFGRVHDHPGFWDTAPALFAIFALGWLYSSARDAANRALGEALQAAAREEANLTAIFRSTQDIVLLLDRDLHLISCNPAHAGLYALLNWPEPPLGQFYFQGIEAAVADQLVLPYQRALSGEALTFEAWFPANAPSVCLETSLCPIRHGGEVVGVSSVTRNITARKQAESELRSANRQLIEASREAGMAEVATGILHNVGNTLNSVNVSVNLLEDALRSSRSDGIHRVHALLESHARDLPGFFASPARGQELIGYLAALTAQLSQERSRQLDELKALRECVGHIASVVQSQQSYASAGGLIEDVVIPELMAEAVRLAAAIGTIAATCTEVGGLIPNPLRLDRHRVLQILVNLVSNAAQAVALEAPTLPRVRLQASASAGRLQLTVVDNGSGIAPAHLTQLFRQGFTTKRDGHGFGLHMCALLAKSLGGSLTAESEGLHRGARFILDLPYELSAESLARVG